jgi:NADP-dependent 3-hydroxy acid dehydrogenase YdfG
MNETAISPVFIVTGASRGIGHAIVQELLRRGARVLGVARKPNMSSQMLVQASTGNCHYLQADVTVESDRLRPGPSSTICPHGSCPAILFWYPSGPLPTCSR